MSKPLKIMLTTAGVITVFALAVAALLVAVDPAAYKPQVEATASRTLGMDVSIGGQLGFKLWPGLQLSLEDVHVGHAGADIATIKEAGLGIELLPLFRRELRMTSISLRQPSLSIVRAGDGTFNFATTGGAGGELPALELAKISLSDGTLHYVDEQSGQSFAARACNLDLPSLQVAGGDRSDFLKHISFAAELSCGEIQGNNLAVSAVSISAAAAQGVFDLHRITTQNFDVQGAGSIRADFSGAQPGYTVHYSVLQFPVEAFLKILTAEKVATGRLDFSANLSMQGKTVNQLRQSMAGKISLRGRDLILQGRDLDAQFSRLESSQQFNLVDVGAFFFAGPLGLVVTKGYNFAGLLQESAGSSTIRTLVSEWQVERGVAQVQDVAMATDQNRLALQGELDFVNNRFIDVTVALIDAAGCTKVRQNIHGPFQDPVVEQPNIITTLTGPLQSLYKMGRDLFHGGKCEVFYNGSVAPPQ